LYATESMVQQETCFPPPIHVLSEASKEILSHQNSPVYFSLIKLNLS